MTFCLSTDQECIILVFCIIEYVNHALKSVQQHMHACTLCTAAVIISSYVGHFFVWRIKCKICVAVLIISP